MSTNKISSRLMKPSKRTSPAETEVMKRAPHLLKTLIFKMPLIHPPFTKMLMERPTESFCKINTKMAGRYKQGLVRS